jgi:DNA-binding SARP family transcriptional activator/tetratricopeptide (TPR) repeat protein/CheY-like chemotaxis protein
VSEFRVLGPVEVWSAGRLVTAGHARQRCVLAVLLVDAGRPVAVDALVDRAWGDAAPEKVRASVHSHVARVRRALELACDPGQVPDRVVFRSGGYLLDIDRDRVDLHRFRRLVEDARRPDTTEQRRVEALRAAVGLWRGEPLAGLAGRWAAQLREGWRRERTDAMVAWAEAELRVGNADVVVGPLTELAWEQPFAESVGAALMRALHAVGRTTDALDLFTAVRRRLLEELGTEPGPRLRDAQRAVLRGDPDPPVARIATFDVAPAGAKAVSAALAPDTVADTAEVAGRASTLAGRAGTLVVPAQLPADVYGFAGRAEPMARLDALLASTAAAPPEAVVISAVSGTAGVGKTALAVHWAHRVADRFPDGQLYVNLRGFDPGGQVMDPADAVRGFLDALGVTVDRIPAGLDAQAALYRSLVAGKQILVVADNARDAEQVRPLLPGTSTALVVVTSRNQLTSLVASGGARPLALDVLSPTEARQMLAGRLGNERVDAEPEAVDQIITACARLPLALAVLAARAQQSGFALSGVAAELDKAELRLDALDAGDTLTDVRAVLSWSYTSLTPAAARLFRLLGLRVGPDISTAAAASLGGLARPETRRLLTELARANLVVEHVPGRYTCHDLLRIYATDLVTAHDSYGEPRAALTRLFDHYVHTAHTAARQLFPSRDPIPIPLTPPAAGANPEEAADYAEAMVWLSREFPVLLALATAPTDGDFDIYSWQLAWSLNTFVYRQGYWRDMAAAWQAALNAADRLGDPVARAFAHRLLGFTQCNLASYVTAEGHFRQAIKIFTEIGDLVGHAHTRLDFGHLWMQQDRLEDALDCAEEALALFRSAGHDIGQAMALNNIGCSHAELGDYARAVRYCEEALAVHQHIGNRDGEAHTWDSLGTAHHRLGQHIQAANCYQQAVTLYGDFGDRCEEGTTLGRLGDTHHAARDHVAARTAWIKAVNILTDLNHPDADGVRTKLRQLDEAATPIPPGV